MVHGCLHGCVVPTSLDGLGLQKEQLDNLEERPTHHPHAHGRQPVGVEDEDLL